MPITFHPPAHAFPQLCQAPQQQNETQRLETEAQKHVKRSVSNLKIMLFPLRHSYKEQ